MSGKIFDINKYIKGRSILGETLPMDMPFTVQLSITEACNFKCFYCVKSETPEEQRKLGVSDHTMSYDDYVKIIDSIASAGKIKLLVLLGWGEPLIHKDVCKMVEYAKSKNFADEIRIITNGAALTRNVSDGLINAGLDVLKISLQGLTSDDYKKTCSVELDYEKFVSNIEYFYSKKTNTKVIVKIMEHMMETDESKRLFRQIYEPISDELIIESLTPYTKSVEQSVEYKKFKKNIMSQEVYDTEICSMPFMRAIINTYGEIVPCCYLPTPHPFGSVLDKSFREVWNGVTRLMFLISNLKNQRSNIPVCCNCKQFAYGITSPNDVLDAFKDGLLEKYEKLISPEGCLR